MPSSSSTQRVVVGLALILIVAGGGCLKAIGDQTKRVVGTDGVDPGENDTPGDDDAPTEEGAARSRYVHAMNSLGDEEEIERWSMSMRVEAASGSTVEDGRLLVDTARHVMVASIESETSGAGEARSSDEASDPWEPPSPPEALLFGQVGRTFLVGSQEPLVLMGNHSADRASPGDGFNLSSPYDDREIPRENQSGPAAILEALQDVPEGAEVSERAITYERQPATEMNVSYENETSSGDLRVVILHEPDRPALVEGTLTGPHVDLTSGGSEDAQGGTVRLTFAYGADATHPQETAMIRAEAMTLSSDSPMLGGSSGTGNGTKVIQPSINPGSIPLEEVQVVVTTASGGPWSSSDTGGHVLTLDAEHGSAQTGEVSVIYEDADGDGAVSPGDRIVLEDRNTSDSKTFSVKLHDEVSGLNVSPGAGLIGLLAGALAAGAIARRSRR